MTKPHPSAYELFRREIESELAAKRVPVVTTSNMLRDGRVVNNPGGPPARARKRFNPRYAI
jgi:hypothetical protein